MKEKVSVIGLGYVGLGIALSAAKTYEVVGLDLDKLKIQTLVAGKSYIEDVTDEAVIKAINHKGFKPTFDPVDIKDSRIVVICVPTPLDNEHNPDLDYVIKASELIGQNLNSPALIINESTSFPGTLRDIIAKRISEISNVKHEYAASPERVDPGNSTWNLSNTPRLLSGMTESATRKAFEFYSTFADNIEIVDSPEIAEAAKLFENTFRQVNIALVNELAIVCNSLNLDVYKVINAAATKPYGFMKFNPGPGVGGHCIPVDPSYLAFKANEVGVEARFIELANEVNLDMPKYVIERSEKLISGLKDKKVLIAGVSYKSDISDIRETPADSIYELAKERGAEVNWYDPLVETWKPGKITSLEPKMFDLVIVQTLHKVFNVEELKSSGKAIFDCTGKLAGVPRI